MKNPLAPLACIALCAAVTLTASKYRVFAAFGDERLPRDQGDATQSITDRLAYDLRRLP